MTTVIENTTSAPETERFVCPDGHPHGKRQTCYRTHGCRCRPCTSREARRKAGERARKRNGLHRGMVDKAWVVGHIEALGLSGMTNREIGRLSGLNEATIHRLVSGKGQMVYPQTAKAILSISLESNAWRAPRAWVSSVGTVRRIQALMAIGHDGLAIGKAIGRSPEWATRTLRSTSGRVEEQSRLAMIEAFERLSMTVPQGFYADRTRTLAARKGYAPPLAWDDNIDDPTAEPDFGEETTQYSDSAVQEAIEGSKPELTPEQRREVVSILNERRWTARRIAVHIGCSTRTVDRIRSELGLPIYMANDTHHKDGTLAA